LLAGQHHNRGPVIRHDCVQDADRPNGDDERDPGVIEGGHRASFAWRVAGASMLQWQQDEAAFPAGNDRGGDF